MFVGGHPHPNQMGPVRPPIFSTAYVCIQQILHGYQTRCEENFYKVDREC